MCFEMFLEQLAAVYSDDIHILQVDNGAFHCLPVSSGTREYNFIVLTSTYT